MIAVLGSDLHITNRTPVARAEKDWFEVLAGYLDQVNILCKRHECPFIVAGDIFDKSNPPPEVINFAIDNLPHQTWAVPGQHDLEYHNYEDIEKTAYWTLVKAKVVRHLMRGQRMLLNHEWSIIGWPWGSYDLEPHDTTTTKTLAVVHAYCWKFGHTYPNAPKKNGVRHWQRLLWNDYDAAVFGDNHKGFLVGEESHLPILNAGAFVRRKIDEVKYRPQVGLLTVHGEIRIHRLRISNDRWCTPNELEAKAAETTDFTELMGELKELGVDSLDFMEALKAGMAAKRVGKVVGDIIRKAAEETK